MKKASLLLLSLGLLAVPEIFCQVNLQTGASEHIVPLYSYSDPANRLETSISIAYTGGNGLKVSEIPSSLGAGWTLNVGGFIQRMQHGEPDDQKNRNDTYTYPNSITNYGQEVAYSVWADTYYPQGYLYSEFSSAQVIDNAGGYNSIGGLGFSYKPPKRFLADLEQDVFMFNFNGQSGYFVIGKKGANNAFSIRTLKDSRLKIEVIEGDLINNNNIRTTISEFRITDETGIKYIFKDAELSEVCRYDKEEWYRASDGAHTPTYMPDPDPDAPPYYKVTRGKAKNQFIKNKWFLSEIINPLTGVKIVFEYEDFSVDFQANKAASRIRGYENRYTTSIMVERVKGSSKRLKKVVLSPTESVEFNYGMSRTDFTADQVLGNIAIKYGQETKVKWEFEQGYFVKSDIKPLTYNFTNAEKVWARLCLLRIKKTTASGTINVNSFDYYTGTEDAYNNVVAPLFSYYQDPWGYSNYLRWGGYFNPANLTIGYQNNPPYEPLSDMMLPYEVLTNPLDDGISLATKYPYMIDAICGTLETITNTTGGTTTFYYEPNYYSNPSQGVIHGSSGVRVSKLALYDGINHDKDVVHEYKYIKEDGSTSAWGFETHTFERQTAMGIHEPCDDRNSIGFNIFDVAMPLNQYWGTQAAWKAHGLTNAEFREYNGTIFDPLSQSFGNKIKGFAESMILQWAVNSIFGPSAWQNFTSYETNSSFFNSHNMLPFQYARVEVIKKLLNDNVGKTVYEFTSPADASSNPLFAIDVPNLPFPFSSRQRLAYWLYGLEKKITYLDKLNNPVKVIENTYNPIKYTITDTAFRSQKWGAIKRTANCDFILTTTLTNDITSEIYSPIGGTIRLVNSKEYTYNSNHESSVAITEYEYTSDDLIRKTKRTNSKGELIETTSYYPDDYTLSGVIQTMKDSNISRIPIATQTLITKNGGSKYMIAGEVTEFGIVANGDIKTVKTYSIQNAEPVPSTLVAFSSNQLIPNTDYYQLEGTNIYDASGKVIQTVSEYNKIATMYDYNNMLPVASIVNADYADVAYTSFEAEGNGGWTFNTGNVSEDFSITGRRSFKSKYANDGATITRAINNTKKYILSFWKKGDNPIMSGATFTLKKSYANSATGYTYYEYEVTNGTTVSLAGRTGTSFRNYVYYLFNLDELRLYPAEARMSTVTYDIMKGKTSECDDNGRVTYYEYDDFGRLKIVRDQDRNVLKAYEYNYKQ